MTPSKHAEEQLLRLTMYAQICLHIHIHMYIHAYVYICIYTCIYIHEYMSVGFIKIVEKRNTWNWFRTYVYFLLLQKWKGTYSQSYMTFSKALSKLKAHSLNVSFHWNVAKETFELWALSFEIAFENVTPSGIGCMWKKDQTKSSGERKW